MKRNFRGLIPPPVLMSVLLCCLVAGAQTNRTELPSPLPSQSRRAAEPLSISGTVSISQSVGPMARAEYDQGPAPSQLRLTRMLLLLKTRDAQSADLESYLRELQDKNSANYHRWLTPQAFGERFGASSAELLAVTGWLEGEGFSVDAVAAGRKWIEFSGTAAQFEAAFHTPLHRFIVNQASFYANTTELQIPAALASLVTGVVSVNGPEARSAHTPPIPVADAANSAANVISVANATRPLTPKDLAALYNLEPLYRAGFDGTGQSIAVVTRSNLRLSDVASFRQAFALPENQPQIALNGDDPGRNADQAEAILDASWAGAIAPRATVSVVASASTNATDGVDLSIAYAVDHAVAQVVSASYVNCEKGLSAAHRSFYEAAWQQAAAEGMTAVVAAGDSGAAACDNPDLSFRATTGLAVNGMASTAYNIAVGGTSFAIGGGAQARIAAKAATESEDAWSEAASGFHAGGGGVSALYPAPAWQFGSLEQDPAADGQHHRYLPDVSLAASAQDASYSGYSVYFEDAANGSASGLVHYAGTSASTAVFAGIMALVDQFTQSPQGEANSHLYGLARMGTFHDITLGDNFLPCSQGTPDCTESGRLGYAAGTGYDLATGLGSPDAQAMAAHWNAVPNVGSAAATLSVAPSSATPTYGSAFSATATLAYSGTTAPTGTVTFTFDGVSQGTAPVTTTAGVTTATLAIPTPTVGSHNLAASYAGDTNFAAAATQSVSVVVSKGTSALSITAKPAVLAAGVPETFTVVVTPATSSSTTATFTGNIQFFDGTTPLGTPVALAANQAVSSAITLDATLPHAITAVYYGDGNWLGSTSPQLTLKGSAAASSVVNLQVSSPVVLAGSIVTLTATIASSATTPIVTPTGSVIFFDGSNPIGQSNVVSNLGVATATYFTSLLAPGVHNITAAYQGDTNYSAGTSPAVNVSIQGYTITPNVSTLSLARGQSGGVVYTLASGGGLNVLVQFSCAPPAATQMTCSFNPATLTGGGQTVLTVTTTAGPTGKNEPPTPGWRTKAGTILACVLFLCMPIARRGRRLFPDRRSSLLALLMLLLTLGAISGCGNSVKPNPNNPSPAVGTPLGVQTLTITTAATINGSTATQHTYLSVDVQ